MEVTKVDDNSIEVTKTETKETVNTYDYGFLKQQLVDIQAQKDKDNTLRDAEIAEVNALILEADKLGVTEKVEPVAPVEEPIIK